MGYPFRLREKFLISFITSVLLINSLYHYWYNNNNNSTESTAINIQKLLIQFWTSDLPPLTGIWRIVLYGGVLLISYYSYISRPPIGDSPLHAPELYYYTLNEFHSLEGAMKLIGKSLINYNRIYLIRTITLISWFCCIIGFGGQLPIIITGLGQLILHGIVAGCIGTSHRWYVPVYTMLALMFANGNQSLSIDSYLSQLYPNSYWFIPPTVTDSPLLTSGFSRKLILYCSLSTLFYGGITKLLNAGLSWMNGLTLAYYVSSEENGRSMRLKRLFTEYRIISAFLSIGSMALELGSFIALFNQLLRPLILISAAGLHFGIWLTMWPNYFPQTWCYMAGQNWMETAISSTANWNDSQYNNLFSSVSIASWSATFLSIFLTFITLFRIEYWPLTGIPMYSFYRDHTYDYKFLRDSAQAQSVALEHINSQYPNALAWSNLWIVLRLKNTDPAINQAVKDRKSINGISDNGKSKRTNTSENSSLVSSESLFVNLKKRATDINANRGVLTKQWRRTLHNIAAADMAAKPLGSITADSVSNTGIIYPGEEWLRNNLLHLRSYNWQLPQWADRTGELQLRCKLKDGYAILAKIPWNPELDQNKKIQ